HVGAGQCAHGPDVDRPVHAVTAGNRHHAHEREAVDGPIDDLAERLVLERVDEAEEAPGASRAAERALALRRAQRSAALSRCTYESGGASSPGGRASTRNSEPSAQRNANKSRTGAAGRRGRVPRRWGRA